MAPPSERRLSHEEFSRLLARAAERHTRTGANDFTLNELIEAGAELAIDAATVRAVYDEHGHDKDAQALVAERARAVSVRPLPAGSRLGVMEEGETLIIGMPPATSRKVVAALVAVVGLGMAGGVALLNPLPWYLRLGFGVIMSLIVYVVHRNARTGYELQLRHNGGGSLVRVLGARGKAILLQPGQVTARLDERVSGHQSAVRRTTYVALDHGTTTHELMEDFTRPEQVWVVDRIRQWLGQS
jgi:hypothetical protein